eukprot:4953316-Prymnesium_polylepis.1
MADDLQTVCRDAGLGDCVPALLSGCGLQALEEWCARDRVGFLAALKEKGVTSLKQRQQLANAIGRNRRQRESGGTSDPLNAPAAEAAMSALRPDNVNIFYSQCNWSRGATRVAAISNQPGAYFRCSWRGSLGRVLLEVASSAASQPFMNLSYAFDALPSSVIGIPHASERAELQLTPPATSGATEGGIATDEPEQHTLTVHILGSVQQYDRWGTDRAPPACSLRLLQILLPPAAVPLPPVVRCHSMIAFGCSITEGVCAAFTPGGKGGDLHANASTSVWAAAAAAALDAEYSIVGFGRQGW